MLSSCDREGRENFSFDRRDNNSNLLKLEGYYYSKYDENKFTSIFLYRNGIMFYGSITTLEEGQDFNEYLNTYDFSQLYDLPYYWGIYKIEGTTIVIEEWSAGNGGEYPVVMHVGEILNDTTIDFGEDDFFGLMRFRQFSPKPDSSTRFIEGS